MWRPKRRDWERGGEGSLGYSGLRRGRVNVDVAAPGLLARLPAATANASERDALPAGRVHSALAYSQALEVQLSLGLTMMQVETKDTWTS